MKCQKCEPLIYLFDELTANEQELLDKHLASCPDCTAKFFMARQNENLIRQSTEIPLSPLDSVRLTENVMDRVFPNKTASPTPGEYIWSRFFRYGFAMASLCIVMVFYAEWQAVLPGQGMKYKPAVEASKEASLVSPTLKKLRSRRNEDQLSLYEKLNKNEKYLK